jgi:hypothetical protein
MRLLYHLLQCGADPNQHISSTNLPGACRRTVWQDWLRSVYLRLKRHDRQEQTLKTSTGASVSLQHVKRQVSDIIAALLRQGADPTCKLCISIHNDAQTACRLVTLADALNYIVSYDVLRRLQALRTVQSIFLKRSAVHRGYLLRKVRTWRTAQRKTESREEGTHPVYREDTSDALLALIDGLGIFCSACGKRNHKAGFAAVACLDCSGRYYTCHECVVQQRQDCPVGDGLSGHIAHDDPALNNPHTHISFERHPFSDSLCEDYGMDEALSTLIDWHGSNSHNRDSPLDHSL